MSAIVDFTVAVLDCAQCGRPFMASHITVALHEERVSCPHCNAEYGTEPDLAPMDVDPAHADRRSRRTRARQAEALRLFATLRRKLQ